MVFDLLQRCIRTMSLVFNFILKRVIILALTCLKLLRIFAKCSVKNHPCLLIQNGALVKTVTFTNPKYIGDPINAVRIFNEEADELIVLDIDATVKGSEPNFAG